MIRLSKAKRAKLKYCSCPVPRRKEPVRPTLTLFVFLGVLSITEVIVAFIYSVDYVIFSLAAVVFLSFCSFTWRLVRGHTFSCAAAWSPVIAILDVLSFLSDGNFVWRH